MNPLEATTPAALFGDALGDPRAMKRAYAKLIREFGPESHPDAFQHIRALYEAANAAPVEVAPPPAEVEGATTLDPAARVDAVLLRLEVDGLDAVLAALAELATQGDTPAIVAHVMLCHAARPGEVPAVVAKHLGAPRTCVLSGALAQRLITHDYDMVGGDTVRRWIDAAVDPRVGAELAVAWVEILLHLERPDDAWAAWNEEEARILAATPERWVGLFGRVLFAAGWALPEAVLARWEGRLHAAGLPIDERVFDRLRQAFGDIRALRAVESDPALVRIVDILRALGSAAPSALALELAVLAAEPEGWERIEGTVRTAPGVYAIVARRLERLSQRDAVAWAQARGETVPVREADGASVDAWLPDPGWAAAERERRVAEMLRRRQRSQQWGTLCLLLGIAVAGGGSALVAREDSGTLTMLGWAWLFLFVVIAVILDNRHKRIHGLHPSVRVKQGDTPWVTEVAEAVWRDAEPIRAWCRREGLWLHEAHHALRRDGEMADVHLGHPLSDLRVIGLRHIRRTLERS